MLGPPGVVKNGTMPDVCAFCGSAGPLTREHLFGQWVSKIGLDLTPVQHHAGPLNGLLRNMGQQPPYRQTVKEVCASCNNGWMSRLEGIAGRALTPLILGQPQIIAAEDQAAIAMWVQKTALIAMLLSSKEQRSRGYGVPQSMYSALYECRDQMEPSATGRFWVGRYEGAEQHSIVQVTPLAVRIPDVAEPDRPQGYAMTIVLGALALQGLVFTTPTLEMDVAMGLGMPQIWPSPAAVRWPEGKAVTETMFLRFVRGQMLELLVEHVELRPWTPATELAPSAIVDGKVQVPALCGQHFYYYPPAVLADALRGIYYAFMTMCECAEAYLIQTESDGAHCKAAGAAKGISEMYEDLPGEEVVIHDGAGLFICKRLPSGGRRPLAPARADIH